MDSTVMHISKGNPLLRGNPKGTHTELKGNPLMRIKMTITTLRRLSQHKTTPPLTVTCDKTLT